MKITRIVQQQKVRDRYSVFVDDAYAFSLSEQALLRSGLAPKQELTNQQLSDWKRQSADDKMYVQALRYTAMRLRTVWEVKTYLERKSASPSLVDLILNKLSDIGLLDDEAFARVFVSNRRLLRPSSKLKLQQELRAKHVSAEAIAQALGTEKKDEDIALRAIIAKKRGLSKFRTDEQKLMQYLARQGFGYDDIKSALGMHDER